MFKNDDLPGIYEMGGIISIVLSGIIIGKYFIENKLTTKDLVLKILLYLLLGIIALILILLITASVLRLFSGGLGTSG